MGYGRYELYILIYWCKAFSHRWLAWNGIEGEKSGAICVREHYSPNAMDRAYMFSRGHQCFCDVVQPKAAFQGCASQFVRHESQCCRQSSACASKTFSLVGPLSDQLHYFLQRPHLEVHIFGSTRGCRHCRNCSVSVNWLRGEFRCHYSCVCVCVCVYVK